MRRLMPAVALALAGTAAACAPHPIVARDPVPPPAPGEAYACDTRPLVLNRFYSGCAPRLRERSTVLQSRG